MFGIPRAPLVLGLAGLIPFLWGAVSYLQMDLALWGTQMMGPRFVGPYVQLAYGAVILSFMSGVLWGFVSNTRAEAPETSAAQRALCYGLSTIPALWAFFMTGGGPVGAASNLIFGFLGLLVLDYGFFKWGLTPPWWMPLRLLLTAVVVICLGVGVVF